MRPVTRRSLMAGLAALPAIPAMASTAQPTVEAALVMAVDASASIDRGLLDFQLRGHAAAFRHRAVAQAVSRPGSKGIAVMLVQFAGPETLTTLVPWRVLKSDQDCEDFAATIDAAPGVFMGGSTALGSAVVQAVALFDSAPFRTDRRTLDIVSNGFSNAGIDPRSARGYAAGANVTVNALAILNEYDWLDGYFAENVIAGRGSFVRTADNLSSFAAVLLGKLVTEMV
ncbi:hypothetical protein CHU95_04655 [Niveispirillum lacus]|uniref:VWFA domain-containing protein n=1 Tax=Niveispirillum lacus TaxID=1981099 RepID=A0A255Z4R2_9PROT|nr:DUF1194 domain-containing protein [Niveispirillum lacus]OYQ36513.1 hypothetical protein CHU95_04655 [Niveispirillum lacus]